MRFVTYNIHSCLGTDRRRDPDRIGAVISDLRADVVALQEVDVGRARSGFVDQAQRIAEKTGLHHYFFAPVEECGERYGIAFLTRSAATLMKAALLPGLQTYPNLEPRGALLVQLESEAGVMNVVNTHLGLRSRERLTQAAALLASEWLADLSAPFVLLGDFNAVSGSKAHSLLTASLDDARRFGGRSGLRPTFPSRFPILALDHCFFRGDLKVRSAYVVRSPLVRRASDHLPLVIDFDAQRRLA
ncbi:hypothetical protein FP2506_17604 [Fulvimarina pelagi HTCC2506]|uniref:Endonuclease/exonuclease/phosphatase domain-containing protein n=1 Tax=Fulvimarina pelagi HTCC2506 TaxID=314231 RepID=Q0FY27_9HYPH|nr:endonuclease/exonuclease/phosphatase family protein [Fulvimarina pelagi]EAU39915.1 hypothetical protein FP2506_17604 [Fulvimarina pelagi HTCC2506]